MTKRHLASLIDIMLMNLKLCVFQRILYLVSPYEVTAKWPLVCCANIHPQQVQAIVARTRSQTTIQQKTGRVENSMADMQERLYETALSCGFTRMGEEEKSKLRTGGLSIVLIPPNKQINDQDSPVNKPRSRRTKTDK